MRSPFTSDNITSVTQLAQVSCGWITQVRWAPESNMLAVAHATGVTLYVNGFGGIPDHVLEGHGGHVKGVAFSPDGKLLASVSADTEVRLWEIHGGVKEKGVFKGHTDSVDAVVFSPDGQLIASAGADLSIRLWNVSGDTRAILKGHTAEITSLAFALNGSVLVSGSRDKSLRLWDVVNETSGTIIGEHDDWVREVAANPPGTMIASACKDGTVCLWDSYGEERYATIYSHTNGADTVAFSPDGKLFATGGRDNLIRLWSIEQVLEKRELHQSDALATLQGHEKPVMSLSFDLSGTFLASGSGDNTVRLWGIPT